MSQPPDPLDRARILGGVVAESHQPLPGTQAAGDKAVLLVLLDIAESLRKLRRVGLPEELLLGEKVQEEWHGKATGGTA